MAEIPEYGSIMADETKVEQLKTHVTCINKDAEKCEDFLGCLNSRF